MIATATVVVPVASPGPNYLILLLLLPLILAIYMVYKIIWHPDFGLPVRRRLLCRKLYVDRDQIAFVPFWWNNLQVRRAISRYWKASMRQTFDQPSPKR